MLRRAPSAAMLIGLLAASEADKRVRCELSQVNAEGRELLLQSPLF